MNLPNNKNNNPHRVDQFSTTFAWLKTELVNALEVEREKNDADLSDVDTAKLRGRIQFIKHLLGTLKQYEAK